MEVGSIFSSSLYFVRLKKKNLSYSQMHRRRRRSITRGIFPRVIFPRLCVFPKDARIPRDMLQKSPLPGFTACHNLPIKRTYAVMRITTRLCVLAKPDARRKASLLYSRACVSKIAGV